MDVHTASREVLKTALVPSGLACGSKEIAKASEKHQALGLSEVLITHSAPQGRNCEVSLDSCSSSPCGNGGTCRPQEGEDTGFM